MCRTQASYQDPENLHLTRPANWVPTQEYFKGEECSVRKGIERGFFFSLSHFEKEKEWWEEKRLILKKRVFRKLFQNKYFV